MRRDENELAVLAPVASMNHKREAPQIHAYFNRGAKKSGAAYAARCLDLFEMCASCWRQAVMSRVYSSQAARHLAGGGMLTFVIRRRRGASALAPARRRPLFLVA